jgi:hypothetical protein
MWLDATGVHAADAPAHTVPNNLAQHMMACDLCHGVEGRATASSCFPRIAGKPAGCLCNQLSDLRDGRRQNPGMANLLDHLSDDHLSDMPSISPPSTCLARRHKPAVWRPRCGPSPNRSCVSAIRPACCLPAWPATASG